jgi:hypothetical protein
MQETQRIVQKSAYLREKVPCIMKLAGKRKNDAQAQQCAEQRPAQQNTLGREGKHFQSGA